MSKKENPPPTDHATAPPADAGAPAAATPPEQPTSHADAPKPAKGGAATPQRRYADAQHAVQSMAMAKQEARPISHQELGHLNTGVVTALRDHASLAELLVKKGVITRKEYLEAAADGMEAELHGSVRTAGATNPVPRFV